MKWTVLSDNRTHDSALGTEHGLSILLETNHHRILLDTGASDLFLHNATTLGIDLSDVDYVFISHGHADHAGGLQHFTAINHHAKIIFSPLALTGKFYSKRLGLHSISTQWPEISTERQLPITQTCQLTPGIAIIAQIPHHFPMPKGNQHLFTQNSNGEYIHDDFSHELVLYADGFLFTGCAHNGLENILSACQWPVRTVVGGFHLLDNHESDEELQSLADKLKKKYPQTMFYTSHCTGDAVFSKLSETMGHQLRSFCCGTRVCDSD